MASRGCRRRPWGDLVVPMAWSFASSSPSPLLISLLLLSLASSFFALSSCEKTVFEDVNLKRPVLNFTLLPNAGHFCQRVHITGLSRLNLKSYANTIRVSLKSGTTLERLNEKTQVCFHQNASIGLCQCEEGEWEFLKQGQWTATMSPYQHKYVDVKLKEKSFDLFTIYIEEEFQQWRLAFLGLGFLLLLIAPIISNWVPFYYSSSMFLGILLVILIVLFQGMKLLPTARKNLLYLTIYGSVLGVGSFVAHYFSTVVNSILVGFGLSEELHNPVAVFLVVGIVLAGAALGYWIVRKFVLSEDGVVDAGIAQFVKWAMRFVATVFFFQSTLDAPLALVALAASWTLCSLSTSKKWWHSPVNNRSLWQQNARQTYTKNRQAEFLMTPSKKPLTRTAWGNASTPYPRFNSPMKGNNYSSAYRRLSPHNQDYYSTYHEMPARKFSKKEWEDFTQESTSAALAEWASTPEVAEWFADNAHRMRLDPDSSDNITESSSASSEETEVNGNGLSLFRWY